MSALCQGLCPPPWALCLPSVPKQFTVGVLNSLSSGVRLCSDGGVWLSGCPEFICPLVAIHLSPNLAGGVQLSGCLQFICLPLYQLICFPVWLVVSGSSAVSNSCPPLWQLICLPIWLVVSGFGCLQFICLALWQLICLPVWLVVSGSSAVSVTLVMSGSLAVSNSFVSKSGWWRLCLPNDSFVSQSGWWCPAFRLAPIHLSPLVTLCLPVWLVVSGSLAVSNSFVSGLWQFICLPVWLVASGFLCCLLSPIHLSSLVAIDLSPSLAGGVRLSGCLQVICFPLWQLICFPVWLVVSGLSAVSNSFVSPYTDSFVSQSGWWCPALAVSNSCVSPCGNPFVSQSGWWCSALCASRSPCGWWCPALAMSKLFASRLWQFICLPVWLVVSGSSTVSNSFVSPCSNAFVSQSG